MSPLERMREMRAAKKAELDALLAAPMKDQRDLNEIESSQFDVLISEIEAFDVRCDELAKVESRNAALEAHRAEVGVGGEQRGTATVIDPPVYAQGKVDTSYFRDLYRATAKGDSGAAERLRRHDAQRSDEVEKRALGNTGAVGGSGGLVLLAA